MLEAIFAQTTNHIIGGNNKLPWTSTKYKEFSRWDMDLFKDLTKRKNIIMGWNTWESLNCKPLKDRYTHYIVTTRKSGKEYICDTEVQYITLPELYNIINENIDKNFVIIGGPSLIDEFYFKIDKVYITTFNFPDFYGKENEYDTFSPLTFKSVSKLEWRWIKALKMSKAINNVDGTVQMLTAEHYEYERIHSTINV